MKRHNYVGAWCSKEYIICLITLVILFALSSCTKSNKTIDPEYVNEIEYWQQLRVDSLKGHTGYINLAQNLMPKLPKAKSMN